LIAPGSTIAVGDRGLTRLYDQEGRYLGSRPGAVGFLSDGGLVTLGKPGLAAYSSGGTLLWALDPWRVVQERLGLGQHLVPNSSQAFVSPAGVIYYFFDYQVTGRDGMLAGLLVVDARGQIVGCEAVPCARLHAVFTVYCEGAARALSFCLPEGHHYADWTPDGRLYSVQLTEDCLIIAA